MVTHITHAGSLSPGTLRHVFEKATGLGKQNYGSMLPGKQVALLFYTASTRTYLSFAAAIQRLGGEVLPGSDMKQFSSVAKGESLEDTIRVVSGYADCIVLRHGEAGAAERASKYCGNVPLINAGDGDNEHPTQAYLDLFTIWQAQRDGRLPKRGLNILFFGDNATSRTVRSLAKLLVSHGPDMGVSFEKISFFGPEGFSSPPEDVKAAIADAGKLGLPDHMVQLDNVDVVYVTRPQVEFHQGRKLEVMPFGLPAAKLLPEHAIIMHPLPRTSELPEEVDADPRAWYFKQSNNGMAVRMALLWHLFQNP